MTEFVKTPVLRGFTEIRAIWDVVHANNAYIAGGYARYMASPSQMPAETADVDVFPADGNSERVADAFYHEGYYLELETDNALTLRYHRCEWDRGYSRLQDLAPTVQIIKPHFVQPTIEATLAHFDFTVISAALLSPETVMVHPCFHEHETAQQLHILHANGDPIRTIMRAMKYYRRGYSIEPAFIARLFDQTAEWEIDFAYWEGLAARYNEWAEW